jgi:hypothetical protein
MLDVRCALLNLSSEESVCWPPPPHISRLQEPALQAAEGGGAQNLVINVIGLLVFAALFYADRAAGEARVEQRRQLRQAQIRSGDREVVLDDQGQKVSRLKEVRQQACAWWGAGSMTSMLWLDR